MALAGKMINPAGVSYDCLAWSPVSDSDLGKSFGWHPPFALRAIGASEWRVSLEEMQCKLQSALNAQETEFAAQVQSRAYKVQIEAAVSTLDPTQKLLYDTVVQWSEKRLQWEQEAGWSTARPVSGRRAAPPPAPEFMQLLLGTAGSGKTHTIEGRVTS